MNAHVKSRRRFPVTLSVVVSSCLIVVALMRIAAVAQTANQGRLGVPVFVTSAGALSGFTDPNKDNQETAKDLRDALKKFKEVTLADNQEQALIVLIVQSREKGRQIFRLGPRRPAREFTVRIKFQFKDIETEMSATETGSDKAASKIAEQVRDWVRANQDKLAGS